MTYTLETTTVEDAEVPALSYRIDVVPDDDSRPEETDALDEADVAAWKADEWRYVGVMVTPVIEGIGDLDESSSDLWGVEFGTLPNVPSIDLDQPVKQYPVPDLIEDVRANLLATLGPIAAKLTEVTGKLAETPDEDEGEASYDHDARPSDDAEPGNHCKDCGEEVIWMGPGNFKSVRGWPYMVDWLHCNDPRN